MSDEVVQPVEMGLPAPGLRKIEGRLRARFRAFLRPGERLRVKVEEEKDFCYAHLALTSADKSFQLDLEGAVIAHDQVELELSAMSSKDRLLIAIEFLSATINDYFRGQRRDRFHPDWRLYSFESVQVRFRGRSRHPGLESQADELLERSDEHPDE